MSKRHLFWAARKQWMAVRIKRRRDRLKRKDCIERTIWMRLHTAVAAELRTRYPVADYF